MSTKHVLLILTDASSAQLLDRDILKPAGYQVTWVDDLHAGENLADELAPDLVIAGGGFLDGDCRQLGDTLSERHPALPLIYFADDPTVSGLLEALSHGFVDCLITPLQPDNVLKTIERGLALRLKWEKWTRRRSLDTTRSLRKRIQELETLAQVGRSVTASLDLDSVLTAVVEAAVELTGAEEGSLLLLDEESGELYMRASRNFQDEFARTFRLPVEDTLAGQVIQAGEPVFIDRQTPQKIKTAYLVHNLIYVPLKLLGHVIGVLGVDNRQSGHNFQEYHMPMLSALADYAAIAIENARLYTRTEIERNQLETILTQIEDIVIVINPQGQLLLVNRTARKAFSLGDDELGGLALAELIEHPDLIRALQGSQPRPYQLELDINDGRIFSVQITAIPEVGQAITMQDITHFKELDRIKSEFVNTVSHDLRSPLTAILGYVELIDRSGTLNAQQLEFIQRVQISVKNITELINNLLDLGRIEAGFDAQKEPVPVPVILNYAVDGLYHQLSQKRHKLKLDLPEIVPPILANPIRLRQMFDNLLENAIKYTPPDGEIGVLIEIEGGQMIIQVLDNGLGIPLVDQPYIFDKLYRASNVTRDIPGTGLGLSIVKSIVESHHGRIWVESAPGKGSVFTVVLPIVEKASQSTAPQQPE